MRPPTRSTRSARPTSRKASVNARGNRGTSNPSASSQVNDEPKTGSVAATIDVQVNPSTLSGLDPAPASIPIVGCFPAWPRTTFVLENEKVASLLAFSPNARAMSGKPTRSRRRMTTDKVEALDAFFRHNTHPSRKEKESICKNLDIDLKTVTIWFQNKRQTAARSRKQLESESAPTAAAMDMLASASATMASLSAMSSVPAMRFVGFDSERSCVNCLSLDPLAPQPLHASLRADYLSSSKLQPLTPLRMPLSAVVQDPNISVPPWFSVSTCLSSLSPELGMPRHNRPIHPEDLWKHIPSSPTQSALSSPDVSTDIDTPDGSMGFSLQRPRTLEWACARSTKRRRTNSDVLREDGETCTECSTVDRNDTRHSSFRSSKVQTPLECDNEYPPDVVHGAVLLLGLKDAGRNPGV